MANRKTAISWIQFVCAAVYCCEFAVVNGKLHLCVCIQENEREIEHKGKYRGIIG